jgi:hypothetical protein
MQDDAQTNWISVTTISGLPPAALSVKAISFGTNASTPFPLFGSSNNGVAYLSTSIISAPDEKQSTVLTLCGSSRECPLRNPSRHGRSTP